MVLQFSFKRNEDELFLFTTAFVDMHSPIPLYNKNEKIKMKTFPMIHSYLMLIYCERNIHPISRPCFPGGGVG